MHIAIDVRSLMEGRHSGVEEYTTQIIRAMTRMAPQHNYHLFYNNMRPVQLPNFGDGRVGVVARTFPNKLLNASQLLTGHPTWDALIPHTIDVVFAPNPRLLPLSPHIPMVVVMHDISFELFPEFLTPRRRLWHQLMRPRQLATNADHVIAVSEHTKQDLVDIYGLSPNDVSVVHSGVQATPAARPQHIQGVRRRYNLPKKFILYLGTIEPRKNVVSIIRAWSAIADQVPQDLVIAGERGWREGEVERAIADSAFADRIHRVGFISESDKAALYAAADVFVYPSFYEGFGFPPLEALLAGTPVITSFNSALPEIVGEWSTLVDPYNTSQIASVMREIVLRGQRVLPIVQQEIAKAYRWDVAAQKTIAILEKVV